MWQHCWHNTISFVPGSHQLNLVLANIIIRPWDVTCSAHCTSQISRNQAHRPQNGRVPCSVTGQHQIELVPAGQLTRC